MKIRVKLISLFITRFLLFFLLIILPLFHPAIVIPYDKLGWIFWFFLIPAQMLIAYFLAPPRLSLKTWILSALILSAFISLIISGITISALFFTAGGMLAFLLTVLVFKTKGRGRIFAVLELFYSSIIYYRLLSFSRASEDIAEQSHGFTQIILAIAICAFCFHALIIYLASFEEGFPKKSKIEFVVFAGLSLPLLLLIMLIIPPNFITHTIVLNNLGEEPKPKPLELDDLDDFPYDNGVPSNGGQQKGKNQLEGVPRDKWNTISRKGNKQYAVMLVITKASQLYAAGDYLSFLDPYKGFIASLNPLVEDAELNKLKNRHLLTTWNWPLANSEQEMRKPTDAQFFSISPERFIAYRPLSVEPTVLTQNSQPFNYGSYSVSGLSTAAPPDLLKLKGWDEKEKEKFRSYLTVNIAEPLKKRLQQLVDDLLKKDLDYYAKVEILLQYFHLYQYETGFTDDSSVASIEKFLFETKSGDCTEFSHAFALLARLAGIPSRVVTGYLISKKLQTQAHREGVAILKQQLDILKEYSEDDIFLVTTSHRHSWAQVLFPTYGWIDMETTQYAIPPPGGMDPNSWQVVIPYEEKTASEKNNFQELDFFFWLRILIVLSAVIILIIIGIYIFKYGLIFYFQLRRKKRDARALQALYTLLLMQMAFRGYLLKKPHQTIRNYATQYPEMLEFAELYTVLRYQTKLSPTEKELRWQSIEAAYDKIAQDMKKHSIKDTLKSWFNLRGLFYRW
jgi:hypothetical protein